MFCDVCGGKAIPPLEPRDIAGRFAVILLRSDGDKGLWHDAVLHDPLTQRIVETRIKIVLDDDDLRIRCKELLQERAIKRLDAIHRKDRSLARQHFHRLERIEEHLAVSDHQYLGPLFFYRETIWLWRSYRVRILTLADAHVRRMALLEDLVKARVHALNATR